jgi:hypothetical protein
MGTSSCGCDSPLTTEAATAFVFFNISARSAEEVASAAGANSKFRTTPAQSNFHSSSASEAGSSDPSQYNSTPRTAQLPLQLPSARAKRASAAALDPAQHNFTSHTARCIFTKHYYLNTMMCRFKVLYLLSTHPLDTLLLRPLS